MGKELIDFKKKLQQLKKYRGRHTELVSVIVPAGCDLNRIVNQVTQEKGTAVNIKSKKTRLNVMTALEKIHQHLTLFKQTPEHGIAIFAGNVGNERDDWVMESIIPPEPLQARVYKCDQTFYLDAFNDMLAPKDVYGLVVIERRGATIGILKGKRIDVLKSFKSIIPGKFRAGGQSAQRFERVIEAMAKDFYKQVSEAIDMSILETKGILLGGPGPTKEEFEKMLSNKARKKIIAIKDIGYGEEYGLRELVTKSEDILAQTEMVIEKRILGKFFTKIAKGEPVEYGVFGVEDAFKRGAVETVLISEGLKDDVIEKFSGLAEDSGIDAEFISIETNEGKEFLAIGGIGAILRYA
ncbi:MAG: peptide chain release factor 1 [Candidatus Altiarchaeota archaeon]|nr:peptide chain release factor 1 [Candidatus Altiarchaeota archaeon]